MPNDENLAEKPGRLIEEHSGFDPRVRAFHVIVAAVLLVLAGGLAYRQLVQTKTYTMTEQMQTERRILIPGPRGNMYDRNGVLLVGNQARFAAVLYLDELQEDFFKEAVRIRNNYKDYKAAGEGDVPNWNQLEQIAHVTVAQRYLDQVNSILGRSDQINAKALTLHFSRRLYTPYTLVDDLDEKDFAKLLENLPVSSPLQLYTTTERFYPYGSAASHVLGYVSASDSVEPEDFPGEVLKTFAMRGTEGKDGLEKYFDSELQGQPGGTIFRVDPAGYKVNPPLEQRLPVQGKNLTTSLDIDLQLAAEKAIETAFDYQTNRAADQTGSQLGAAVALDCNTGEVLVLASKPDYDLNKFYPRLSPADYADILARGALPNVVIGQSGKGLLPPGSTFKTLVTIAGLRHGTLSPDDTSVDCEGSIRIGGRTFRCDNGLGHHGNLDLRQAIAESCDIYFWRHAVDSIGPQAIADEARRFHLDRPTGIELPGEDKKRMIIPDPQWKLKAKGESWTDGDTANMAIGQGYVQVTPLMMACYVASLARGETYTVPTLLHDAKRPVQHTEPIGITREQRAVLLDGMEGCTETGTAKVLTKLEELKVPGVRVAGKTGTAQYANHLDIAWFICFAPIENPQIAIAVAIKSDKPGENYGGGRNAVPIASVILKKFFEKLNRPAPNTIAAGAAGSP